LIGLAKAIETAKGVDLTPEEELHFDLAILRNARQDIV